MSLPRLCAIGLLVAGAARALAGCGADEPAAPPVADDARPPYYAVEVPPEAPVRGPREAPVTIVVFDDFQAPRAARNARGLAEIVERFGGSVRVVHRANPLPRHEDAQRAELAARAAGRQGKFWELHDALHSGGRIGEAELLAAATGVGCDVERLRADMQDPQLAAVIARDRQAALELGISEAPACFVNGRPLPPVGVVEDAVRIVEEELNRANAELARGTSPARLYAALIAGGQRQLPGARRVVRRQLDPEAIYRITVDPEDPVLGPPDAPLTIVEFADFECPFSARSQSALQRLRQELGDRLRVVFKHHPLPSHPNSALAAEAAVEAQQQGRFWQLHDLLFASWDGLSPERIVELGVEAGLDRQRLAAALADRRHGARVARDRELADRLGLSGTPHFYLNGRLTRGSRSFDQLLALALPAIDEATRLDGGTPDAGTPYERLTAGGATEPVYLEPGAAPVDPALVSDGRYRVYDLQLPADAPTLGPPGAPVTLIQFGDYQCGWCGRVYPIVQRLRARYGDRLRVGFMHYPVAGHEHAGLAAEAAVEAQRQGRFWQFHERLLANQAALSREDLLAHGAAVGLDADRLGRALDERTHRQRVKADLQAGRAVGVAGTPTFFVSGRRVPSPGSEEAIAEIVDHLLGQGTGLRGDR